VTDQKNGHFSFYLSVIIVAATHLTLRAGRH